MAVRFSKIVSLMQSTLHNNNLVRPTALKNLQTQEDGGPYKILVGSILSAGTRDDTTTQVIKMVF
ncbi:MAG: DNA lyase, partial [Nitrososphaerota archaeon]